MMVVPSAVERTALELSATVTAVVAGLVGLVGLETAGTTVAIVAELMTIDSSMVEPEHPATNVVISVTIATAKMRVGRVALHREIVMAQSIGFSMTE